MELSPKFKRESEKIYQTLLFHMKKSGISGNERIASFFVDFFFKLYNVSDTKSKLRYFMEHESNLVTEIINLIKSEPISFECLYDACFIQNVKTAFEVFLSIPTFWLKIDEKNQLEEMKLANSKRTILSLSSKNYTFKEIQVFSEKIRSQMLQYLFLKFQNYLNMSVFQKTDRKGGWISRN